MLNKKTIIILSVAIPLVVIILFRVKIEGVDLSFLPHIYAPINALTAIILPIAIYQIKKGNRKTHERLMKTALMLSISFLLMYVLYHATTEETKFGGTGFIKVVYIAILVSHIILSIFIVPLVLNTYFRAITNQFPAHKKLGKITFLLWEYVAITGVVVYLMIRPYYA
jgi:putative membrane protein